MNNNYSNSIPFQNISKGMSTQGQVDMLVNFLEYYLPSFPSWFSKKKFKGANETKITYELCRYLFKKKVHNDESLLYPFEFILETPQGSVRRTDMGVHINARDTDMELIYCIETKRLPTARSGNDREKEYVLGNLGGINRFKQNFHGITDEGALISKNAIVGYIEAFDFSYWETKINNWISVDTTWGNKELLSNTYSDKIAKLESEHIRIGGQIVNLTHFWIIISGI